MQHASKFLQIFQKFAAIFLIHNGQRWEVEGKEQASVDKAARQDRKEGQRSQEKAQEGDEEESGQVPQVQERSRRTEQLSI